MSTTLKTVPNVPYQISLNHKVVPKQSHPFTFSLDHTNNTLTHSTSLEPNPTMKSFTAAALPTIFSLVSLNLIPPILDQGQIGSCVANAFAFNVKSQTNKLIQLSRLHLYAVSRILDDIPLSDDAGTTLQSACKAISQYGYVQETVYPYTNIIINYTKLSSLQVFQSSKLFKTFSYSFVAQNLASIKACLVTYHVPVIFGFLVYSSFMTAGVANTGTIQNPNIRSETLEGGHCMNIIGYNDTTQRFTCANSWGTGWGASGFCTIPYAYILNPQLASDFCFIKITQ
jgi:C1A family cysteine protease